MSHSLPRTLVVVGICMSWLLFLAYALLIYPNQYTDMIHLCQVTDDSPRCTVRRRHGEQWKRCAIWVTDFMSKKTLPLYGNVTAKAYEPETFLDCYLSVNEQHYIDRDVGADRIAWAHVADVFLPLLFATLALVFLGIRCRWWTLDKYRFAS